MRRFRITTGLAPTTGLLRAAFGRRLPRQRAGLAGIDRHLLRDIGVSPMATAAGAAHPIGAYVATRRAR